MMELLQDVHFWLAVSFVIFVYVARKPLTRVIFSKLDEYARKVNRELEQAEKLRAEAEAMLEEYKQRHRDMMQEAEDIITHAEEEAQRLRQKAEEDIALALAQQELHTFNHIARAEAAAVQEIRDAAIRVTMAATRKLLAEQVNGPIAERIFSESVAGLNTEFLAAKKHRAA